MRFPEREIVLVHAVLNEDVQAFRASFDVLAQKHKNLKVYYRYSDAPQTAPAMPAPAL
jgi:ferredoxin-NADP reductase